MLARGSKIGVKAFKLKAHFEKDGKLFKTHNRVKDLRNFDNSHMAWTTKVWAQKDVTHHSSVIHLPYNAYIKRCIDWPSMRMVSVVNSPMPVKYLLISWYYLLVRFIALSAILQPTQIQIKHQK